MSKLRNLDAPSPGTASQIAQRARLQAQLDGRLRDSDEAGRALSHAETLANISRPVLRGAVDLADGVLALPRLIASAPVGLYNVLAGADVPLPINQSVADVNPKARNVLAARDNDEQLASTITRGLGGVLSGVGIGGALGAGAGTAGNVGRVLAANPALQTVGAITGGVSSEAVRRRGGGAVAQLVAGLAGAVSPGLLQSGLSAAGRAASAARSVIFDRSTVGRGAPISSDSEVVDVSPSALIRAHRATDPDYAQYNKVQAVSDFASKGKRLSLPEADVVDGKLAFTNGRNRAKLAEESGLKTIPVAVSKGTGNAFKRFVSQYELAPQVDTLSPAASTLSALAARRADTQRRSTERRQ